MRDFKGDFAQGQTAADKVTAARNEIKAVLSQLNKDVSAASKGAIDVRVEQQVEPPLTGLAAIGAAMLRPPSEPKRYWAIIARNPKAGGSTVYELARWQQHRNGYPCTVTWGGAEHQCSNREALEKCLGELLRDAGVSLKFQTLMQQQLKVANSSPKAASSSKPPTKPAAPQKPPTTKPKPSK
ncbi:MAG: hypothetical protein ACLPT4_09010 [Verrucomicrobiia bacterium]